MSSYINFSIQSRTDLQDWILRKLGHPLVTVELTTDHLDMSIDDALEYYTEYAEIQEKYVSLDLDDYVLGDGISLSAHNAKSIFTMDESMGFMGGGVNTMFSMSNQMYNAGMIPYYGAAGGMVTFECALQFQKMVKKMSSTAYDYNYNPRTQSLTLYPDPKEMGRHGYLVVGIKTIPPIEDLVGEHYVKKLALASSKMILGTIRKKFEGVQLPGGGTIDTSIGDEGKEEWDKWTDEIVKWVGPHQAFLMG